MDYSYKKDYFGCGPSNEDNNTPISCGCKFNIDVVGLCDVDTIRFSKSTDSKFKTDYNWTEISIPEILTIPSQKPDIEHIDRVLISASIQCTRLVETPSYLKIDTTTTPNVYSLDSNGFPMPLPNAEGTYLTGRKLIIEGVLKQKIVYTADVVAQSVHSVHFQMPFTAFIIVYPKFLNSVNGQIPVNNAIVDVDEDFCVETCIEDVYTEAIDERTIFKNVTLFVRAKPANQC